MAGATALITPPSCAARYIRRSAGVVEHLTQIGQKGLILAQRLAGRVGQLGDGLAVASGHFHDDVERSF